LRESDDGLIIGREVRTGMSHSGMSGVDKRPAECRLLVRFPLGPWAHAARAHYAA